MKSKEKRNSVIRGDWFEKDFLNSFLISDHKLKEHLNNQEYRLMDVVISSRVLNHWYKFGIINDNRANNKGWKKFSVTELIWIHIVLKLRKFGLDLEKIKNVKDSLDIYNNETNISKCPLLDYFIGFTLYSNEPIKLLVFENGEAEISPQIEIDYSTHLGLIQDDYISIDMNKLVSKVTYKPEIKADYLEYSSSEIAKELDKALYLDDIKSIAIKTNKGKDIIITKEHIRNSKGDLKSLIKTIGSHFEETTVHSGKKIFYKVTEKKRIKK